MKLKRFTATTHKGKMFLIVTDPNKRPEIPEGYTKHGSSFLGYMENVTDKTICIF